MHLHRLFALFIPLMLFTFTSIRLIAQDGLRYQVFFEGVYEAEALDQLKKVSRTYALQTKFISNLISLKKEAESDLPVLINALHYIGYYNSTIDLIIDRYVTPIQVRFVINLGAQFRLAQWQIISTQGYLIPPSSFQTNPQHLDILKDIPLSLLDLSLNDTISTQKILNGEKKLIDYLKKRGYPSALIAQRTVVADPEKHTLGVTLTVDIGPLVHFGPVSIKGLKNVKQSYVLKKLYWKEGEIFDSTKILSTQNSLEKSKLFDFISIQPILSPSHPEVAPFEVQLQEAKHHSIGCGFGYTSDKGLGIIGEWEHRNVGHTGKRFSCQTELWEKKQNATLTYQRPDFKHMEQNLSWIAEFEKEKRTVFDSSSFKLSYIFERQLNQKTEAVYGLRLERIKIIQSNTNRVYLLFKVPLQIKWNNTNHLLNPTRGHFLNIKMVPTEQLLKPVYSYLIHNTTFSSYYGFFNDYCVLATKVTLGNIWGADQRLIPLSERLYSGSENTLRGYTYQTVSPLNRYGKPVGGRSLLIGSIEARLRPKNSHLGWIAFYEVGNVYATAYPQIRKKQLQSAGFGLRYPTPIGPIRFDIAFPIKRRKKIDPLLQVYVSIGQTF